MFVDRVRVHLRGGDGGAGVASFRRQKGKPRGRPEGGSGGPGGDVSIIADESVTSLLRYQRRPHHQAGAGTHGQGGLRHGKRGDDLLLSVPVGTVVHRDDDGALIADLAEPGLQVTVVRGGRGGRGNQAFVSSERRAPTFAEQGEYGDRGWFTLELKLLADAALVGFPNAGKSTLIGRVSAAKPKVADYPFTTLQPHLGVVAAGEREFVLADIPGLIEGAASGKGLGQEFLRHVERASVLVVLLDPSPVAEHGPADQYRILIAELRQHDPQLVERTRVVVLNKADLGSDYDVDGLAAEIGEPVPVISALDGTGLDHLVHKVADLVDHEATRLPHRPGFILHEPVGPGFSIRRSGDRWLVEGKAAERAIALADLTVPEAADFAAQRLDRLGVDAALREAGAQPGDDVEIGGIVFEFQEEALDAEENGDEWNVE